MSLSIAKEPPLAEMNVADSHFLGFCCRVNDAQQARQYQQIVKARYPEAAHVPVIHTKWQDEDGEPPGSVAPGILELLTVKQQQQQDDDYNDDVAVIIVRFFASRLLGVTCGRLPQCYASVARLSLHRFQQGRNQAMTWKIPNIPKERRQNVYGMGAGDCELILNVVPNDADGTVMSRVLDELNFGGFRGAQGEELPRLQNLQADMSEGTIPVYRYPGNYNGQEWATYQWSKTSLEIKKAVEEALLPLVDQQMNHCVTNYYRHGDDFIAHHSDKDLDLNREGVIVSVSLGEERTLELRRRQEPKDITQIVLPHGSMLTLGPETNRTFSHSILPKKDSNMARVSLTLRDVKTFLDLSTGRLYGQGVDVKSLRELRKWYFLENLGWLGGFLAFGSYWKSKSAEKWDENSVGRTTFAVGAFTAGMFSLRFWRRRRVQHEEEQDARAFFSKSSMSGTKY